MGRTLGYVVIEEDPNSEWSFAGGTRVGRVNLDIQKHKKTEERRAILNCALEKDPDEDSVYVGESPTFILQRGEDEDEKDFGGYARKLLGFVLTHSDIENDVRYVDKISAFTGWSEEDINGAINTMYEIIGDIELDERLVREAYEKKDKNNGKDT